MTGNLSPARESSDDHDVNRVAISLRFHPTDLASWKAAAKKAGFTLTEWIERNCNAAIKPTKRRR